jgi:hypothetical protein
MFIENSLSRGDRKLQRSDMVLVDATCNLNISLLRSSPLD